MPPPFGVEWDDDDRSLTFLLVDRVQAGASPSRLNASADRGTGALILNQMKNEKHEIWFDSIWRHRHRLKMTLGAPKMAGNPSIVVANESLLYKREADV